jgi:hypothetical protein
MSLQTLYHNEKTRFLFLHSKTIKAEYRQVDNDLKDLMPSFINIAFKGEL